MPDGYPSRVWDKGEKFFMTNLLGMHDRESVALGVEDTWVLDTIALSEGINIPSYTDKYQWITRVNWGYGSTGTLPQEGLDSEFLTRFSGYLKRSVGGCTRWIIGNEPNLPREWPDGKAIHPNRYGTFFQKCANVLRSTPGHENDKILIAASGPWNDEYKYNENPTGDWIKYFQDQIFFSRAAFKGFSIHAYTHGYDPNLVWSEATMDHPFENRHYNFRTYRDYCNVIPSEYGHMPIYLTESNGNGEWQAVGLMQAMAREVEGWNRDSHSRKIYSLIMYRGPKFDQDIDYSIMGKPAIEQEYKATVGLGIQSPLQAVTIPPDPGGIIKLPSVSTGTLGPDKGNGNREKIFEGLTNATLLNVRDRPGVLGSKVLERLEWGVPVEIYEEKTLPDGSLWYRVGEDGGWVAGKYIDVIQEGSDNEDCWRKSMNFIKKWEGGWADNPHDPGGATNKGVTFGTFKKWRALQGMPEPTKQDLRDISDQETEKIFYEMYWKTSGADKLKWPMCLAHMNIAVNGGPDRAKQFLTEVGPRFVPYMARCIEWYTKIDNFEHFGRAWIRRCADLMKVANVES